MASHSGHDERVQRLLSAGEIHHNNPTDTVSIMRSHSRRVISSIENDSSTESPLQLVPLAAYLDDLRRDALPDSSISVS